MINFPYQLICHFDNFHCSRSQMFQQKNVSDILWSSHLKSGKVKSWSSNPDNKVDGANMGHTWGQQDQGGPHVGPMNLAIWESISNIPWCTDQSQDTYSQGGP